MPYCNVKQLAAKLGVCRRTIYNLVDRNEIPKPDLRVHNSPRWDLDKVLESLKEQRD